MRNRLHGRAVRLWSLRAHQRPGGRPGRRESRSRRCPGCGASAFLITSLSDIRARCNNVSCMADMRAQRVRYRRTPRSPAPRRLGRRPNQLHPYCVLKLAQGVRAAVCLAKRSSMRPEAASVLAYSGELRESAHLKRRKPLSENLAAADDAIRRHVTALVEELVQQVKERRTYSAPRAVRSLSEERCTSGYQ